MGIPYKKGGSGFYKLLLLIALISGELAAQNIVPNSSFEDYIDFSHPNLKGWHRGSKF